MDTGEKLEYISEWLKKNGNKLFKEFKLNEKYTCIAIHRSEGGVIQTVVRVGFIKNTIACITLGEMGSHAISTTYRIIKDIEDTTPDKSAGEYTVSDLLKIEDFRSLSMPKSSLAIMANILKQELKRINIEFPFMTPVIETEREPTADELFLKNINQRFDFVCYPKSKTMEELKKEHIFPCMGGHPPKDWGNEELFNAIGISYGGTSIDDFLAPTLEHPYGNWRYGIVLKKSKT